MSCKDPLGGTHHFACDCREAEFKKTHDDLLALLSTERDSWGKRETELMQSLSQEQARSRRLREALDKITEIPIRGGDPNADIDVMVEIAKTALAEKEAGRK